LSSNGFAALVYIANDVSIIDNMSLKF